MRAAGARLVSLLVGSAKGRYLDQLPAHVDMYDLEAATDDTGPPEQCPHLLGGGVGGDVEILDLLAQQGVAHATTYHQSAVAGGLEFFHHFASARAYVGGRHLVSAGRDLEWRAGGRSLACE